METTKILKLIDALRSDVDSLLFTQSTNAELTDDTSGTISNEDLQKINQCVETLQSFQTLLNQLSIAVESHSQDLSQITSNLQDLSTEINQIDTVSIQNQLNHFEQRISSLFNEIDHYYVGSSYSDYPAGTILQTYDSFELHCNKSTTMSLETPKIYFHAETGSCGKIIITIKYVLNTMAQNILFNVYLNNISVAQYNISHDIVGEEQIFSATINDLNFNTTDSSNVLYVKMERENTGTNSFNFVYEKIEILAPNANILNKVYPYSAIYLLGKYYLTDSSNGYLKYTSIEPENMVNMQSLSWIETEIPSIVCLPNACYTQYGQGTYIGNESSLIFLNYNPNDLLFHSGTIDNNINLSSNSDLAYADQNQMLTTSRTYLCASKSASLKQYNINVSTNKIGISTGESNCACNVAGIKLNRNQLGDISNSPMISINTNGECTLRSGISSSAKKISLGYGSGATLYLDNRSTAYNYSLRAFIKRYDKIVEYKVNYDNVNNFTIVSQTEIGNYDKFFLMPNNDYFVIRNGELKYHKFPTETLEE